MISYTTGNMFDCGADCLFNAVNCEGFMGKGLAYQFKTRFPQNFKSYAKACKSGELTVGKVHYTVENGVTVINFPSKNKWKERSKIEYIETGMKYFTDLLPCLNVRKIAIPPLGCGNGGLLWDSVKNVIVNAVTGYKDRYDFIIFEPSFLPEQNVKKMVKTDVEELVLLEMIQNLKNYKYNMKRLQKAGYFMNIFLEEEYFKFSEDRLYSDDGPYSDDITRIAGVLKEFQKCYGVKDTQTASAQIYQTICSERVDKKLEKLLKAVKKSTDYINSIPTDEELDQIVKVLYLVLNGEPKNKEKIIDGYKLFSKDDENTKNILGCIESLENTAIITSDIFGNYTKSASGI